MKETKAVETLQFWQSRLLNALPWLHHGITERGGGISQPPFASLNLGLHVGDTATSVLSNREKVAAAVRLPLKQMVCAEQIHGNRSAFVTEKDAGRGAESLDNAIPGMDALVTGEPNLLLTLFFADCLPVLLADTEHQAVAVAHAGWRGLVGGVLENTLQTMAEQFGSRPESLIAAIGPGIGPCCFEVGAEVAERFPASVVQASTGAKPRIDLPKAAWLRLMEAGIPTEQIDRADICTACHTERFFSHRRENGQTGRMGAFMTKR